MSEPRTYRFEGFYFPERDQWGDGPWQDEPDKLVWVDDATGLDCMIVRNTLGALCGYVGVPEGHPWYGSDPFAIDALVHGGLNFGEPCVPGVVEGDAAVCHDPARGATANPYWVGFDCGHGADRCPITEATLRTIGFDRSPYGTYRDVAYVRDQVAVLAVQAKAAMVG